MSSHGPQLVRQLLAAWWHQPITKSNVDIPRMRFFCYSSEKYTWFIEMAVSSFLPNQINLMKA